MKRNVSKLNRLLLTGALTLSMATPFALTACAPSEPQTNVVEADVVETEEAEEIEPAVSNQSVWSVWAQSDNQAGFVVTADAVITDKDSNAKTLTGLVDYTGDTQATITLSMDANTIMPDEEVTIEPGSFISWSASWEDFDPMGNTVTLTIADHASNSTYDFTLDIPAEDE